MTQTYSTNYLHFYSVDTDQEETDVLVTRAWRGSQELDLEDASQSSVGNHYTLSQEEVYSLLQAGDVVENNYCHGLYRVVFE